MKKSSLKIACLAMAVLMTDGFVAKAQEPFYDTKRTDGKIDTKTGYVMGYSGLYEKNTLSEYTYDEEGNFLMKEVFIWNCKYKWYDKRSIWIPDYSESNWIPSYRIVRNENPVNEFITLEYFIWDARKKAYNKPVEKMIYQLNGPNRFNYLAYQAGNKYTEWVNNIDYDREFLAELTKLWEAQD